MCRLKTCWLKKWVSLLISICLYLWILVLLINVVTHLKSVLLWRLFLLLFQATHTVCHYEEIICTNNHAGFSLGLPVFGEHDASDTLTCSTVLFQTTDHSDWTSARQELYATVSPWPCETEWHCLVTYLYLMKNVQLKLLLTWAMCFWNAVPRRETWALIKDVRRERDAKLIQSDPEWIQKW